MSSHRSSNTSSNGMLIFLVCALFMITLTFIGVFYVESGSNLNTIQKNQTHNSQNNSVKQQDLDKITCAMWHTMTTSPSVHPSPSVTKEMNSLCG